MFRKNFNSEFDYWNETVSNIKISRGNTKVTGQSIFFKSVFSVGAKPKIKQNLGKSWCSNSSILYVERSKVLHCSRVRN